MLLTEVGVDVDAGDGDVSDVVLVSEVDAPPLPADGRPRARRRRVVPVNRRRGARVIRAYLTRVPAQRQVVYTYNTPIHISHKIT